MFQRQVEQAIVHNGYGVSHRTAFGFRNLYGNGAFGLQFIGHFNFGLQMRGRVFHRNRNDAVHANGQVVFGLSVWLQERDIRIHCRRHFGRSLEVDFVVARFGCPPRPNDAGSVFNRNQRLACFSGGNGRTLSPVFGLSEAMASMAAASRLPWPSSSSQEYPA